MKKNNTAEKAILEADKIAKALKEGTEKNLQSLIDEAISKIVKESQDDEDEFDVEDVDTDGNSVKDEAPETDDAAEKDIDVEAEDSDSKEGEEDADDSNDEGEESDDAEDWSDEEAYKVSDNDFDMRKANGDEVLKMFNKLDDDDQLFITKDDNGDFTVNVDEPGEYVIKLDADADADEEDSDNVFDDDDFDFGDEEGEDFDADEFGDEDIDSLSADDTDSLDDDDEIELDLSDESEDDEDALNEEDLGYTDDYQKDVFSKKFNMSEPANKQATYGMDHGIPDGSSKPWAGKGDMKPFENKVDEGCDECGDFCNGEDCNLEENGSGFNTLHAMKKNGANRTGKGRQTTVRCDSEDGEYKGTELHEAYKKAIAENKYLKESMTKMVKAAKAAMAENKQYMNAIDKMKGSMRNIATLCVNEGRIINLLVNETTTKDERKSIVERYNSVKTLQEGKTLYDEFKRQLNEVKSSTPSVEKQFVAESTNKLNETTFYASKNDPSLSLMERMENISKFYKK